MASRPRKRWSELTPAYRTRLERAYKAGKYGQGYSSAGRAYAAKAPAQVARGQAKTSEAERSKARRKIAKAKAWSDSHSHQQLSKYRPPKGADTVQQGEYAQAYLDAMKELEKGWKRGKGKGEAIDTAVLAGWYDYLVEDDEFDSIADADDAWERYLEFG